MSRNITAEEYVIDNHLLIHCHHRSSTVTHPSIARQMTRRTRPKTSPTTRQLIRTTVSTAEQCRRSRPMAPYECQPSGGHCHRWHCPTVRTITRETPYFFICRTSLTTTEQFTASHAIDRSVPKYVVCLSLVHQVQSSDLTFH